MANSWLLKSFDQILQKESTLSLLLINQFLGKVIPFNQSLNFKVKALEQGKTEIFLPYRKPSFNHLDGIHACALATLGELCAGMGLIRELGLSNYRPILADLKVHYNKQAKGPVTGICHWTKENFQQLESQLKESGQALIWGKTLIADTQGKDVCQVETHWQLKDWKKVKTKI